ncbi:MAG: hypothetical protein ACK5Q5_21315 [Planctomycetaceae bacterium]
MSTATEPAPVGSTQYLDFDQYVDFQLQKTRAGIRTADLLTAVVVSALALLSYLFLFVVFDHWVIPGGFSDLARLLMLLGVIAGLGAFLTWKIILPARQRVTALYAAKELEKMQPGLRSNLLTLVDLKRAGRPVAPQILSTMQKRAAKSLAETNVDEAVNRRPLLWSSYALCALLAIMFAYVIFSPKKISASIWRALLPTANVSAATRTEIHRVTPGNSTVLRGEQVTVEADLAGEIPPDVRLLYSTADQRYVDEPMTMQTVDDRLNRFRCVLTGERGRGLLQNVRYRIEAGDAVSADFTLTVQQPPSATVEDVAYRFPDYTRLSPRTDAGATIDAWEGTQATIRASVNQPVVSAIIQYGDDEQFATKAEEFPMTVRSDGRLEGTVQLRFRGDGSTPQYYRIQVKTADGASDPRPIPHPLRIRPDLAPKIVLHHPRGDQKLAANAIVPLAYRARDPDFLLHSVTLFYKRVGDEHARQFPLGHTPLNEQIVEATNRLPLPTLSIPIEPGTKIAYWLEVRDNLEPFPGRDPNIGRTPVQHWEIIDPVAPQQANQQFAKDEQQAQQRLDETRPAETEGTESPADQPTKPEPPNTADPNAPEQPTGNSDSDSSADTPPSPDGDDSTSGDDPSPMPAADPNQAQSDPTGADPQQPRSDKRDPSRPVDPMQPAPIPDQSMSDEPMADQPMSDQPMPKQKPGERPQPSSTQQQRGPKGNSGNEPSGDSSSIESGPGEPSDNSTGTTPNDNNNAPNGTAGKGAIKSPSQPQPNGPAQPGTERGDPSNRNADSNAADPETPGEPDQTNGQRVGQQRPGTSSQNHTQPPADRGPRDHASDETILRELVDRMRKQSPPSSGEDGTQQQPGPSQQKPESTSPQPVTSKSPANDRRPAENRDSATPNRPAPSPDTDRDGRKPSPKHPDASSPPQDAPATNNTSPSEQPAESSGQRDATAGHSKETTPDSKTPSPTEDQSNNPSGMQPDQTSDPADPSAPKSSSDPARRSQPGEMPPPGLEPSQVEKPTATSTKLSPDGQRPPQPGATSRDKNAPNPMADGQQPGAPSQDSQPAPNAPQPQQKPSPTGDNQAPEQDGSPPPGSMPNRTTDSQSPTGKESRNEPPSPESDPTGGQQPGGQQPGGQQPGGQQPGGQQPGGQQPGGQQPGGQQPGGQQPGGQQPGGQQPGGQQPGGQQPGGPGSASPPQGGSGAAAPAGGGGERPVGPGTGPQSGGEPATGFVEEDLRNLDDERRAAELVLKQLQDELQRGTVDDDLKRQLGVDDADLQDFVSRLQERLSETGQAETPESRDQQRQFEELLRSIDFDSQGASRAADAGPREAARGAGGVKRSSPAEYREDERALRELLNKLRK